MNSQFQSYTGDVLLSVSATVLGVIFETILEDGLVKGETSIETAVPVGETEPWISDTDAEKGEATGWTEGTTGRNPEEAAIETTQGEMKRSRTSKSISFCGWWRARIRVRACVWRVRFLAVNVFNRLRK